MNGDVAKTISIGEVFMPPVEVLSETAPVVSITLVVIGLILAASGLYVDRTLREALSRSWLCGALAIFMLLIATTGPKAKDQIVKGDDLKAYAYTVGNHPSLKPLAEVQAADKMITVVEYRQMSDAVDGIEAVAANKALADIGLNQPGQAR